MSTVDYIIIVIYLIVIILIGLYAGRGLKTIKEYAVANQSYGAFVLMATLSASFIGGGFSFGNADTVFIEGLFAALALWGFSLALIFIAIFIAPNVGSFRDCISTGDIMQKQFGKSVRILSGFLGTLVCTGILAAQIGAIGAIFTQFTALSFFQGVLLGCGIVILYTAAGGMKAVVLTDLIQFILLFLCIPLALIFGINYLGGMEAFIDKVPPRFFAMPQDSSKWLSWIGLFLSFLIGETLVPPYVQRLLIAKSPTITKRGTFWSGVISVPFFVITGAIGIVAYAIDMNAPSNLAMPMVIGTVLPIGLKGLAAAAIISIVMSSADSFLNAASVCLIEDVIRPLTPKAKRLSIKAELTLSRILTLVIGVGAIVISLKIENVLNVLRFAYNFWAPVMLIPLICVLLHKKVFSKAFWCSAIVGSTTVIIVFSCFNGKIFFLDPVVFATFLSGTTFCLVNAICKKIEKE